MLFFQVNNFVSRWAAPTIALGFTSVFFVRHNLQITIPRLLLCVRHMRGTMMAKHCGQSISEFVNLTSLQVCSCASMQALKMKIPSLDSVFQNLFE